MRVMDPPPYETPGGTGIFGPQAPGRLTVSGDEAQDPLSDTTERGYEVRWLNDGLRGRERYGWTQVDLPHRSI